MKRYADIVGDGGSNIVSQVQAAGARLQHRLESVRQVIAVTSGKGGVGKSTLTAQLAGTLAARGAKVGILDGDLNGASISRMTGVTGYSPTVVDGAVEPATAVNGVRVLSIDLFLPDETAPVEWNATSKQDAFTWRPTLEMTTLREMLSDTNWGVLDYLLLDLPPGSHRLPNVSGMLPETAVAISITIPSAVSQAVVHRAVRTAREWVGDRLLGLVDNMAGYVCGHCGELGPLFPQSSSEELSNQMDIPYLGSVPFDPRLAMACDGGQPIAEALKDTPALTAIEALTDAILAAIEARREPGRADAVQHTGS